MFMTTKHKMKRNYNIRMNMLVKHVEGVFLIVLLVAIFCFEDGLLVVQIVVLQEFAFKIKKGCPFLI